MLSQYDEVPGSPPFNRIVCRIDVTDGLTTTLLLGERSVQPPPGSTPTNHDFRTWIRGNLTTLSAGACKNVFFPTNSTNFYGSNNLSHVSFGSNHSSGANFALSDGSVRYRSQTIEVPLFMAAASIDSGEVVALS